MFQEVLRRDWMFKLVGKETFSVGRCQTKATINIDAVSGFAYEYTLEINGKSLKKYMENRSKVTSTWLLNLDGSDCRVVLGEALTLFIYKCSQTDPSLKHLLRSVHKHLCCVQGHVCCEFESWRKLRCSLARSRDQPQDSNPQPSDCEAYSHCEHLVHGAALRLRRS